MAKSGSFSGGVFQEKRKEEKEREKGTKVLLFFTSTVNFNSITFFLLTFFSRHYFASLSFLFFPFLSFSFLFFSFWPFQNFFSFTILVPSVYHMPSVLLLCFLVSVGSNKSFLEANRTIFRTRTIFWTRTIFRTRTSHAFFFPNFHSSQSNLILFTTIVEWIVLHYSIHEKLNEVIFFFHSLRDFLSIFSFQDIHHNWIRTKYQLAAVGL